MNIHKQMLTDKQIASSLCKVLYFQMRVWKTRKYIKCAAMDRFIKSGAI